MKSIYWKCLMSNSFLWITLFCCLVQASKREIKCFVKLETEESSENEAGVVHVIADGVSDSIHFLWSIYKFPSVIIARTSNDTELSINMTKLKDLEKDAITFSKDPFESIGLTFSELWKLTYEKDSSDVRDVNDMQGLDLDSFKWSHMNSTLSCSKSFASLVLKSYHDDVLFSRNGTVEIQFSVAGKEGSSSEYPHLIFNGNSTQIKVVLDHLHSNSSRTRYGLQTMLFSSSAKDCYKEWSKAVTKSVNDENSPGVFSDISLTPPYCKSLPNSFVTWRPVAYTGKVPIVANSSEAQMTSDCKPIQATAFKSIAELYFEGRSEFSAFNITFGTAGDGFYPKTEYTAWSLMIGTGSPIKVKISAAAIIFMTIGLGTLVLFFVGGGVFLACQRWCKKDDDLLLNEASINN